MCLHEIWGVFFFFSKTSGTNTGPLNSRLTDRFPLLITELLFFLSSFALINQVFCLTTNATKWRPGHCHAACFFSLLLRALWCSSPSLIETTIESRVERLKPECVRSNSAHVQIKGWNACVARIHCSDIKYAWERERGNKSRHCPSWAETKLRRQLWTFRPTPAQYLDSYCTNPLAVFRWT